MKEVYTGSGTIDLSSTGVFVPIPINAAALVIENLLDRPRRLIVNLRFDTPLTAGTVLSFRLRQGQGITSASLKQVYSSKDSITLDSGVVSTRPIWQSIQFYMTGATVVPVAGDLNFFSLEVSTDTSESATASVTSHVYDLDDLRSIGGEDVTLSSSALNVNAAFVGGATPITAAENDLAGKQKW